MKKNLSFTMLAIAMLLTPVHAGMTLVWEKDISTYLAGGNEVDEMKRYSDGSIALSIGGASSSWDLLVYNVDGNVKLHDVLTAGWLEFEGHASASSHLVVEVATPDWLSFSYRIYEFNGVTNTVTNITNIVKLESNTTAGIDTSVLYVVQDSMLKKYKLSGTPSVLDAAVASGIDGSNYILNWNSKNGIPYQIQSSANLTNWVDVGSILTGTGDPMTWANALTNSTSFYRIIEQ